MTRLGEKKEGDLSHVGSRGDVNQVVLVVRIEGDGAREVVERALTRSFPGARITKPRFAGLAPALGSVSVEASVEIPPFPQQDGGFDLKLATWDAVRGFAQAASRSTPLQVEYLRTRSLTARVSVPDGYEVRLPTPAEAVSPFGRWRMNARRDGAGLTLDAALELSVDEVSPAAYPRFRAWLAALDRALARPLEVRRIRAARNVRRAYGAR